MAREQTQQWKQRQTWGETTTKLSFHKRTFLFPYTVQHAEGSASSRVDELKQIGWGYRSCKAGLGAKISLPCSPRCYTQTLCERRWNSLRKRRQVSTLRPVYTTRSRRWWSSLSACRDPRWRCVVCHPGGLNIPHKWTRMTHAIYTLGHLYSRIVQGNFWWLWKRRANRILYWLPTSKTHLSARTLFAASSPALHRVMKVSTCCSKEH